MQMFLWCGTTLTVSSGENPVIIYTNICASCACILVFATSYTSLGNNIVVPIAQKKGGKVEDHVPDISAVEFNVVGTPSEAPRSRSSYFSSYFSL